MTPTQAMLGPLPLGTWRQEPEILFEEASRTRTPILTDLQAESGSY